MKKRQWAAPRQAGSALVITLLGLMLLTIIVIAFMQTMSLALTTSKSYSDIRRATLAAQAGLDTAIAQITMATGTNLAFVTGLTNFPTSGLPADTDPTNFPVTVIGAGNLTNFDQMMPLVSGPLNELTNFGSPGFSNNFNAYASLRASGNPVTTIDVNTPYQFIQDTADTNMYRAAWVTMTNMVGNRATYTRYAYVVLDDAARVNPRLMTGAGAGFSNSTNWYTGPQDIGLTNASAQLLTESQMAQVIASSNSFAYSDTTLGETFPSRADYEAVKHLFTSQTNASFDVIPAWLPNGGTPKYNINDLATNTAYGATPMARAANIAGIITNNLPNFYMRDAAMNATNSTLYVNRLAANILTYISPDGTWPASEYTTNFSGISPQVNGVFPISLVEEKFAATGGAGTTAHTSASIVTQFWLNCWNPYTTPVTNLASAVLHVWNRPSYVMGDGAVVDATTNYTETVTYMSNPNGVARPNEFVTLGFPPVTNTITCTTATTLGPSATNNINNGGDSAPYEQYSLTMNGQTVAQTMNQPSVTGLQNDEGELPTFANGPAWELDCFSTDGSEVGDPRFQNYEYNVWECTHALPDWIAWAAFNGYRTSGGGSFWQPWTYWTSRDNIARQPAAPGNLPASYAVTPDQLDNPDPYATTDASAAPEIIRNGPMVSIGELGNVFDPAYANDQLTAVAPGGDGGGLASTYLNGGARSLRIGRPEATGATTTSAPTSFSWDVDGKRGISLLDLFTVNNANMNASGTNTIAQNLISGGALGRINPNTASTNVLASVLSGIEIDSDTGMAGGNRILANLPALAASVAANRPYSSLADLYKIMPIFDADTNYFPNFSVTTTAYSGTLATPTLAIANRVHQEAFGKLIQHLTVQSRTYRIYVIGQVLDSSQNPHVSVAMEVGIYLQYNQADAKYEPAIQYVHLLK